MPGPVSTVSALRCTCPRCYGKNYYSIVDWLADHRDVDVREHEVGFHLLGDGMPDPRMVFVGDDEDGQVMVELFAPFLCVYVAYRLDPHESWGPPIQLDRR